MLCVIAVISNYDNFINLIMNFMYFVISSKEEISYRHFEISFGAVSMFLNNQDFYFPLYLNDLV